MKVVKLKRIISSLLVAVMLILAACSEPQNANSTDSSAASETDKAAQTTVEETTEPKPSLPTVDYEGYEFRILLQGEGAGEWRSREVIAEEANGEALNDAIYKRNLAIEEQCGIKITGIEQNDYAGVYRAAINASDDAYDTALIQAPMLVSFATGGMLLDMAEIPYIDFSMPWWDDDAHECLSVGGRLYFTYGDFNICDKDLTWFIMFNKKIAADYNIGDLYGVVSDGKWTLENFTTLTKGVTTDLNGDGKFDTSDLWGHVTPFNRTALALLYSCGVTTVVKDADDIPVINIDNDKTYTVYGDILKLYFEDNASFDIMKAPNFWRQCEKMFSDNQILFYTECMQNVERMRAMNDDFGILPMPKYSETDASPLHMVCDFASALSVPVTCSDSERTGIILEAMTAASTDTVLAAYYEICLKTKYSRDEQSSAMIDIILRDRYYDVAYIYGWGGLTGKIMSCAETNNAGLKSALESVMVKTQKALDDTVAAYKGLSD